MTTTAQFRVNLINELVNNPQFSGNLRTVTNPAGTLQLEVWDIESGTWHTANVQAGHLVGQNGASTFGSFLTDLSQLTGNSVFDVNDISNGVLLPADEFTQELFNRIGIDASIHKGFGGGHRAVDHLENQILDEMTQRLDRLRDGGASDAELHLAALEMEQELRDFQTVKANGMFSTDPARPVFIFNNPDDPILRAAIESGDHETVQDAFAAMVDRIGDDLDSTLAARTGGATDVSRYSDLADGIDISSIEATVEIDGRTLTGTLGDLAKIVDDSNILRAAGMIGSALEVAIAVHTINSLLSSDMSDEEAAALIEQELGGIFGGVAGSVGGAVLFGSAAGYAAIASGVGTPLGILIVGASAFAGAIAGGTVGSYVSERMVEYIQEHGGGGPLVLEGLVETYRDALREQNSFERVIVAQSVEAYLAENPGSVWTDRANIATLDAVILQAVANDPGLLDNPSRLIGAVEDTYRSYGDDLGDLSGVGEIGSAAAQLVIDAMEASSLAECFPAGTMIEMADGTEKPIELVQTGDWVMSFDPSTQAKVPGQVGQLFRGETPEWIRLNYQINGVAESLSATGGHPFLTPGGDFKPIEALVEDNNRVEVVSSTGEVVVAQAQRIAYSAQTSQLYESAATLAFSGTTALASVQRSAWATYNFEVIGTHTYIAENVRVHNRCLAHAVTSIELQALIDAGVISEETHLIVEGESGQHYVVSAEGAFVTSGALEGHTLVQVIGWFSDYAEHVSHSVQSVLDDTPQYLSAALPGLITALMNGQDFEDAVEQYAAEIVVNMGVDGLSRIFGLESLPRDHDGNPVTPDVSSEGFFTTEIGAAIKGTLVSAAVMHIVQGDDLDEEAFQQLALNNSVRFVVTQALQTQNWATQGDVVERFGDWFTEGTQPAQLSVGGQAAAAAAVALLVDIIDGGIEDFGEAIQSAAIAAGTTYLTSVATPIVSAALQSTFQIVIPIPILGAIVGSLIGRMFGSLFGSDPEPKAFAGVEFDFETGLFVRGDTFAQDDGDLEMANNMAGAYLDLINSVLQNMQANSHNFRELGQWQFGHDENAIRNTGDSGVSYESPTAAFYDAYLTDIANSEIVDGNLAYKRALLESLVVEQEIVDQLAAIRAELQEEENEATDTDEEAPEISPEMKEMLAQHANIRALTGVAVVYSQYLENQEFIDQLLVAAALGDEDAVEPAAFWSNLIRQAEVLGLDESYVATGDAADNYFRAAVGDDVIDGGLGADTIITFSGDDTLEGGKGNDLLLGGLGDDSLNGGEGSDVLIGEAGSDTLRGGEGSDIYVVHSSSVSTRIIETSDAGFDILRFEGDLSAQDITTTIEGSEKVLSWLTVEGTNEVRISDAGAGIDNIQFATGSILDDPELNLGWDAENQLRQSASDVVDVAIGTTAAELNALIQQHGANTTFQLQEGEYYFDETIRISADNVALLGAGSGQTIIHADPNLLADAVIQVGHRLHEPQKNYSDWWRSAYVDEGQIYAGDEYPHLYGVALGQEDTDPLRILLDAGSITMSDFQTVIHNDSRFEYRLEETADQGDTYLNVTQYQSAPVDSVGNLRLDVFQQQKFAVGDYVYIYQDNTQALLDELHSGDPITWTSWVDRENYPTSKALRAQMAQVTEVEGNKIHLSTPLTFDYEPGFIKIEKREVVEDNLLSGFSIVGGHGTSDPNLYENTIDIPFTGAANNEANEKIPGQRTSMIMVGGAAHATISDIDIIEPVSHGITLSGSLELNISDISVTGAHNKGKGGTGYGVWIRDTFDSDFSDLTVLDARHAVIFGGWNTASGNTIHVSLTNRDINFHGGLDQNNTVIVDETVRDTVAEQEGLGWATFYNPGTHYGVPTDPTTNPVYFRRLTGTSKDDTYVFAQEDGAIIDGVGGHDSILGGAGNDTLDGGTGNDTLWGSGGDDLLILSEGSDVIDGGEGVDRLETELSVDGFGIYITGETVTLQNVRGVTTLINVEEFTFGDQTFTLDQLPQQDAPEISNADLLYERDHEGLELVEILYDDETWLNTDVSSLLGFRLVNVEFTGTEDAVGVANLHDNQMIGNSGANWLEGRDGNDTIDGLAGADTLIGGSGDDELIGGAGDDSLGGNSGNDLLSTGSGDDYAFGGVGDDTFEAAEGSDTLEGGEGNDAVVFQNRLSTYTVEDAGDHFVVSNAGGSSFVRDIETLRFDGITVTSENLIAAHAQAVVDDADYVEPADILPNDLLPADPAGLTIVDGGSGWERHTSDVSFQMGTDLNAMQFATEDELDAFGNQLDNNMLGNTAANRLEGGIGADKIYGRAGDDTLLGGLGDDSIDGSTGNDMIYGGEGADTIVGGSGDDIIALGQGDVSVDGGTDTDTLIVQHQFADVSVSALSGGFELRIEGVSTIVQGIETFLFTDQLIQSENLLSASSTTAPPENDVPDNSDQIAEGTPEEEASGGQTGTPTSEADGVWADADTFGLVVVEGGSSWERHYSDVSFVMGNDLDAMDFSTDGDLNAFGNDLNNNMLGSNGNNRMEGGLGNDKIIARMGNDTVLGGNGDDTLDGNGGIDHLFGGNGNDFIEGGSGNDIILSLSGNDTVDGEDGDDTLVLHANRSSYTVADQSGIVLISNSEHSVEVTNVESFIFGSTELSLDQLLSDASSATVVATDSGTETEPDESSTPADSDETAQNDGDGTEPETDQNETTNPTSFEGIWTEANNLELPIFGTTGSDSYSSEVSWIMADGLSDAQFDNDDSIDVIGNSLSNDINGNDGHNRLEGREGDDTIDGYDGNDIIVGGLGNDDIEGDRDDDVLSGGAGNDTLDGGSGDDTFVFLNGFASDLIEDFGDDSDILILGITGIESETQALSFASEISGGVVFDFGSGDILTLDGIEISDLAGKIEVL